MKLRADVSYRPDGSRVLGSVALKSPTLESDVRLSALLSACNGDLASLVRFEGDSLQQWASRGFRLFMEIFRGQGFLSVAVSAESVPVAPGIDRDYESYGQCSAGT